MSKNERRSFEIELRQEEDGKKLRGHAAVFDVLGDGGWFKERVARGAFADSIAADDIRALWNHDPNHILGRNRAGTLRLAEDWTGLAIEIDPPDTQFARDLLVSIARGDVSQMSFGFVTLDDSWEKKDGVDVRTLEKVRLLDVSPVTFPFYPQTDIDVVRRSHETWAAAQTATPEHNPPANRRHKNTYIKHKYL